MRLGELFNRVNDPNAAERMSPAQFDAFSLTEDLCAISSRMGDDPYRAMLQLVVVGLAGISEQLAELTAILRGEDDEEDGQEIDNEELTALMQKLQENPEDEAMKKQLADLIGCGPGDLKIAAVTPLSEWMEAQRQTEAEPAYSDAEAEVLAEVPEENGTTPTVADSAQAVTIAPDAAQ